MIEQYMADEYRKQCRFRKPEKIINGFKFFLMDNYGVELAEIYSHEEGYWRGLLRLEK